MAYKELIKGGEHVPAVENHLMRSEQARYYMAWHRRIGDQKRVVDNAMGPNISSDLFLTNATEIVAVDAKGFCNTNSPQYVTRYWDLVDRKPIFRAGAFGYADGTTAEGLELPEDEWELFREHCDDRWCLGYWDIGALNHWDIDRLLFLEMKKMGVDQKTISIQTPSRCETRIKFDWAYPGESPKPRQLIYLTGVLDRLLKTNFARYFRNINCYLQKGLETPFTAGYIRKVLPYMSPKAVFAIGYIFRTTGENGEYKQLLSGVLGKRFEPQELETEGEKMIDDLQDDEDFTGAIARGIRLHIFRGQV